MDKTSQKTLVIIGIIFLAITILAVVIVLNDKKSNNISNNYLNNNNNNNDDDNSAEIYDLKDHSRFFTITNCLNKYYGYVFSKKYDTVYNLLSVDYIQKNEITSENIINKINFYNGFSSISSEKVYYQKLKEGFSIYYVHSILSEDIMDADIGDVKTVDVYNIVYLNEKNLTFSVEPFKGEIFTKGINNE